MSTYPATKKSLRVLPVANKGFKIYFIKVMNYYAGNVRTSGFLFIGFFRSIGKKKGSAC